MKKTLLLAALLLSASTAAFAGKLVEREFTCPVCANSFYAKLDVDSGQCDMRLDLKPVGECPAPWRLPDCPKCGFVIYAITIPKGELALNKRTVASPDYAGARERSSYYRLALLFAGQGRSPFAVGNAFLKASWQEEAEPAKLKDDLERALKCFQAAAAGEKTPLEEKENSQLLAGELLRRLGRFDEALVHLRSLRGTKGFTDNFFGDILDYQVVLCLKKDAGIYEMEDVRARKKGLWARLKRWNQRRSSRAK
jgi:tetratricopeptide (TPR) repeat protein